MGAFSKPQSARSYATTIARQHIYLVYLSRCLPANVCLHRGMSQKNAALLSKEILPLSAARLRHQNPLHARTCAQCVQCARTAIKVLPVHVCNIFSLYAVQGNAHSALAMHATHERSQISHANQSAQRSPTPPARADADDGAEKIAIASEWRPQPQSVSGV